MRILKKLLPFLVVGLVFVSCRKTFETDWDVDLAAPIARSNLNIKNFISDTIFQSDNNGVLHLQFSKPIASFKLDTLVKIPDTLIVQTFTLPANFAVTPGMVLPGFPQTTDIDFQINNNVELKKAIINSGNIKIVYTNTFTEPLVFDLVLPSTTKYGMPFTIHETVNPGVSGNVRYYDVSGYDVNMTGISGNKTNTLKQTVTIAIANNASPAVTQVGQKVQADISYTDLVPYYVEGYFGQQFLNVPYDSVALNISNSLQASNFQINSASINFKIVNEFGVDINAQLSNIKSRNTYSNTSVTLNAAGLSNLNINKAGKTNNFSYPVFPSVQTVSVNTSNSNLNQFLNNLPDYLTYSGNILINPLGNVSGSNDFAFLNTGITIYADVDMPLELNADYFKLTTTTPIDLSGVKQLDNINYGDIVIQATNGFPFNAVLQGYLLNDQKQIIDSLFAVPGNVIQAGKVDANNKVYQEVYTKILIPFTTSKLQNLKLCKTVKFVSQFNLPPQPPDIKIYDNYNLNVILSVDVNYKATKK
jgi:hypothetical protein